MRSARVALVTSWLALVAGCDEVGAPLVDRLPPPAPPPPTLDCVSPPSCQPPRQPEPAPPRSIAPIDLGPCGAPQPTRCALREASAAVEVGAQEVDGDADPDGDVEARADADAGIALEGPALPCASALGDAVLECGALEWIVEGGEHLVRSATLRNVNLGVRATRPSVLVLDQPDMEQVFVAMQGPITLRVLSPRRLQALRVTGAVDERGEPRLELLDAHGDDVQMGAIDAVFGGTLGLDRVELTGSELAADRLDLQSVSFDAGRIQAEALTAADVQVSGSSLALGDALFAAFTLTDSTFERCAGLRFVTGKLVRTPLPACSGPPVRVYDSVVLEGRAEGRIESDGSIWERVAFGSSAPTELVAFGGRLRGVNFCRDAERTLVGDQLAVSCSMCDGWSEPGQLPCRLRANEALTPYPNFCALLDVRTFAACPAPVPARERPLVRPF